MISLWFLPIAYLLGSIPFGWLVAKIFYNTDIRAKGSGNIGATNALRQFGTLTGVIVLLLDMAKGAAVVLLARTVFTPGDPLIVLSALFAILGHVFPVWLGFRGGKGVATAGGVFLALAPVCLGITLLTFIIIVALTRFVSVGSMLGSMCFFFLVLHKILIERSGDYALLGLVALVVIMIFYTHRQNLARLINGNENKITFTKKGKS